MLLIMAEPTFSMMNMDLLLPGINGLEELVKSEAKNFDVKAGLTGGIVLGRDEMVAGTEDSMMSVVGTLNMMTAMMAVILVGLGIDFSIHIISVYTELTNMGENPKEAIIETMKKVGTGIITGGLTTAAAFLTF